MGLQDVIASAVSIAKSVTADLQANVTFEAWTGQTSQGMPTFASSVTLPALIEGSRRVIRMPDGDEAFASHKLTILQPVTDTGSANRREPVDVRDKFTLPDGRDVQVLRVDGLERKSTTGPFMLEIWCG